MTGLQWIGRGSRSVCEAVCAVVVRPCLTSRKCYRCRLSLEPGGGTRARPLERYYVSANTNALCLLAKLLRTPVADLALRRAGALGLW